MTYSGGSAPFTFADDSTAVVSGSSPFSSWAAGAGGTIREGFVNKQRRQVQRTHLFRAPYLANIPRYNLENRLRFTVQRAFQTAEACMAFIAAHPDSVPAQGALCVTHQSPTGQVSRYLRDAVVESIECVKHTGVSCDFTYTIAGNSAWQTSP